LRHDNIRPYQVLTQKKTFTLEIRTQILGVKKLNNEFKMGEGSVPLLIFNLDNKDLAAVWVLQVYLNGRGCTLGFVICGHAAPSGKLFTIDICNLNQ